MTDIDSTLIYLRLFKIGDYSIFDLVLTFLLAYLLSFPLKQFGFGITRKQLFYLAIPFSIIIHKLFGIHTPLTDRFFNPKNYYVLKISMLYLTYKGIYNL